MLSSGTAGRTSSSAASIWPAGETVSRRDVSSHIAFKNRSFYNVIVSPGQIDTQIKRRLWTYWAVTVGRVLISKTKFLSLSSNFVDNIKVMIALVVNLLHYPGSRVCGGIACVIVEIR